MGSDKQPADVKQGEIFFCLGGSMAQKWLEILTGEWMKGKNNKEIRKFWILSTRKKAGNPWEIEGKWVGPNGP